MHILIVGTTDRQTPNSVFLNYASTCTLKALIIHPQSDSSHVYTALMKPNEVVQTAPIYLV